MQAKETKKKKQKNRLKGNKNKIEYWFDFVLVVNLELLLFSTVWFYIYAFNMLFYANRK